MQSQTTNHDPSLFVGQAHGEILELLYQRVRALGAGDDAAPRIVLLRGPSGVGKTKIVRELYQRLVDAQHAPAYWPSLEEGGAVERERKVIGPPVQGFVWPAEALPDFAWWSLTCGQSAGGEILDLTNELGKQVASHVGPLGLSWRSKVGWTGELAASRDAMVKRVRELATTRAKEQLTGVLKDQLLQLGLDLAIPGWAKSLAGDATAQLIQRARDQRRLGATVELGEERADDDRVGAQELAASILATARADLPAVVVVEDLHLMGEPVHALLDALMRQDKPVLVIGTVWPEGAGRDVFADWIRGVDAWSGAQHLDVPQLDVEARRALVLHAAPATDASLIRALADKYTSPYELRLLLELDRIRRLITDEGAIALSVEEIDTLPASVQEFHKLRWLELPPNIRTAMRLAAHAINAATDAGKSVAFIADVVDRASRRLMDGIDVTEPLNRAANPFGWVTEKSGALRFADAPLAQIAASEWGAEFGPGESQNLATEVINTLHDFLRRRFSANDGLLDPDDLLAVVAARWLLSLPGVAPGTREVAAAGWLVATLTAAAGWHASAVDLAMRYECRKALNRDDGPTVGLRMQLAIVEWMELAGFGNEAIDLRRQVARDTEAALGPTDELTLRMRLDLIEAEAISQALGQTQSPSGFDTSDQLRQLMDDVERHFGADDQFALEVRAAYLKWSDREMPPPPVAVDSLPQWDALLREMTRVLGENDPETLMALKAYSRSAQLTDSSRLRLMRKLEGSLLSLTSDPRVSAQVRYEIATLMQWSEGPTAALAFATEARAELEGAHGPTHPDTLGLRAVELGIELDIAQPADTKLKERLLGSAQRLVEDARASVGNRHIATRDAEHVLGRAQQALAVQTGPDAIESDGPRPHAEPSSDDQEAPVILEDSNALATVLDAVASHFSGDATPLKEAWSELDPRTFFGAMLVTVEGALACYVVVCEEADKHGYAPAWFDPARSAVRTGGSLSFESQDLLDEYVEHLRQVAIDRLNGPHSLEIDEAAKRLLTGVALMQAHLLVDDAQLDRLLYQDRDPGEIVEALLVLYGQTVTGAAELVDAPFETIAEEAARTSMRMIG